jgi:hypothetical protein
MILRSFEDNSCRAKEVGVRLVVLEGLLDLRKSTAHTGKMNSEYDNGGKIMHFDFGKFWEAFLASFA